MSYWDRFYMSGKISDYLKYAAAEKEDSENVYLNGTDTERKR